MTCVTNAHTSLAEVNHMAALHLKQGGQRLILHGPRKGRTTKATAMSPVAKNQAMYFIGIIFRDSLQRLYEVGAIHSPVFQVGSRGQKWLTKRGAEPGWSWVLSRSSTDSASSGLLSPMVGQIRWVCKCSLTALDWKKTKNCHIHLR